jgi:hypothetical protein
MNDRKRRKKRVSGSCTGFANSDGGGTGGTYLGHGGGSLKCS